MPDIHFLLSVRCQYISIAATVDNDSLSWTNMYTPSYTWHPFDANCILTITINMFMFNAYKLFIQYSFHTLIL